MCCDGPFQRLLIQRASKEFDLVGIVLYRPTFSRHLAHRVASQFIHPIRLMQHLIGRWVIRQEREKLLHLEEGGIKDLENLQSSIAVDDINSQGAVDFLRALEPQIVLVNGTNLLKQPMLQLMSQIKYGMINLHTGLSPYSRGGNCNLFMLLEGKPECVGVTVHYISPGIDDGDIILSARPEIGGSDTFENIESKCFLLGIEMLINAVVKLLHGTANRVPQWEHGKLFLKRTGYIYRPWHRYLLAKRIRNGLITEYLEHKENRDQHIRLVDSAE